MVDDIVKSVVADDYNNACQTVRDLTSIVDIKPYQEEDLDYYLELRKALETVLLYYFVHDEANDLIAAQKRLDTSGIPY